MKVFYVLSIMVVVAMVLSPLLFLKGAQNTQYTQRVVLRYNENLEPVYNDNPVVSYDSYGSAIRSIDPTTCGDTTSSGIQGNIYEGLYTYHYLLRPLQVVPLLAEAMPEISEDRLTYTIRLKKGVKYHRNPCFGIARRAEDRTDGGSEPIYKTREVKAEDFVLAFKRTADYHNTNTSLSWAFLSGRVAGVDEFREKTRVASKGDFSRYDHPIEGVKALDEYTLQIRLIKPFPQFKYVLALHNYAPCPREAIDYWLMRKGEPGGERLIIPEKDREVEFREAEMVIGTGAYMLHTFKRKHLVVLVRNPDYRDVRYPTQGTPQDRADGLLADAGKKVPFIDVVELKYVAESFAAWMRFLSGQTDKSGVPRDLFEQVISLEKDLRDEWRDKHIYLKTYWSPAVYWFAFNMEDPVLRASPSLRRAMCLCYDVNQQIETLYNGRGKRAINCVPSTIPGSKQAGQGPYYQLNLELARTMVGRAKEELRQAGLLDNGEIPPIELAFGGGLTKSTRDFGEFAAGQFAKIGIKAEPVYYDWPSLQQKVHNKVTQVYTMGWHADYPDAENFLQLFYSGNIKKGTNNTNYSDKQFDEWYEKARIMPESPERMELYVRMINKISDDVPVLMLSEPQAFVLFYEWYQNYKAHPIGYGYTQYRKIDVDMRRKLKGRN